MGALGWLLFPGGEVAKIAYKAITSSDEEENYEVVRKEEIERVSRLIKEGRDSGVENIEIEISRGLAKKLELSGGGAVEGIPANAAVGIDKNSNGTYTMKVKYLPATDIDKINDYHKLLEAGKINQEQYEKFIDKLCHDAG